MEVASVLDAVRVNLGLVSRNGISDFDVFAGDTRDVNAESEAGRELMRQFSIIERPAPQPSRTAPPSWAKVFYKSVAVVDGKHVSVFDGVTEYRVGHTLFQPHSPDHGGGLYVYRTQEACLRADAETFPSSSAMLQQPRALARVLAWNELRETEPIRYGEKLAFEYLHVQAFLPYPVSWQRDGVAAVRREISEEGARLNERQERRRVDLRRTQAATLALEEEVQAMEQRLRSLSLRTSFAAS